MSGTVLPCGSRVAGHRHTVAWQVSGGASVQATYDHADPLLWTVLAHQELRRGLGEVSGLWLDGEHWAPNPRDGWNALSLLRQLADRGERAATRVLAAYEKAATTW